MTSGVRRPRRVASDEAHSWARNLRLGNPLAKLILQTTTLYVNGEGVCWVSIEQLADDTELAANTVRKRMAWLEHIGAIARMAQWIDESGVRNGAGRGKRTTDEIRLLLGADPDLIEGRARDNGDDDGGPPSDGPTDVSPPPRGGLNADISPPPRGGLNPASPAPALQQPSNCVQGTDSLNHEPEQAPQPPLQGGDRADFTRAQAEADPRWLAFVAAWGFPITDFGKAVAIWSAMTVQERDEAIIGAKGYHAFIDGERKSGRNRAVKDVHRWLRDKLWIGFVAAGHRAVARAGRFDAVEGSPQWTAWMLFYAICGKSGIPDFMISQKARPRSGNMPCEWPPVGREFPDPDLIVWMDVPEGSAQFAAWARRLRELPNTNISMRSQAQSGGAYRHVLRVPSEWPPSKGTREPTDEERAQADEAHERELEQAEQDRGEDFEGNE